jgi:prevent-host-death family protein
MDGSVTQRIKASEVRQDWSQLINRVFLEETRVIVERSGIPVAAIIPIADLERLNRLQAEHKERFKPIQDTWQAFKDVPAEEIEREVAQAIAAIRQERVGEE